MLAEVQRLAQEGAGYDRAAPRSPLTGRNGAIFMRPETTRLPPLSESDWTDEQRELLARFETDGELLNIFRTLVHHPKLLKRWAVFANHLLAKSSLPARDREIVILRTAWLCDGEYEWGQHLRIGNDAGLSRPDFENIARGPLAAGLEARDATLLRAVDELHSSQYLRTATWNELSSFYSNEQLLDLIFTVGQYTMLAMALNSLGVELEEGREGFPQDSAPTMELSRPKAP